MIKWARLGQVITKDAWPVWLLLGGLVGAWDVAFMAASSPEEHILYAGTSLQLLGLGTVANGILELCKKFEVVTLKDSIHRWWERLKAVFEQPVEGSGVLQAADAVSTSTMDAAGLAQHR
ncbi:hypothetical protein [Citrifermentans bremense]|uniref:hypothetical protein n=1 Tax=Citrifermentans bremense TaxID=60035 RepID=UPI000478C33B|nr:hypothetical protein [Citrifermentans bremense]